MKVFPSLFLLLAAASWQQTALAWSKSKEMNIGEVARTFLGLSKDEEATQPTDMLVIGAGLGRTGTSSFVAALEDLGLQSYNMKAAVKSAGHLDLSLFSWSLNSAVTAAVCMEYISRSKISVPIMHY